MFTPAVAFYSRQTMILPGLAADEGSYARGRKKRNQKKKKDMAPVQSRNVSAQEIKTGSMCFSLALSLPACLPTCWITDQVQEILC